MPPAYLDASLLARLTLLATLVFALILLGLHVLQREFDPLTRYVSEYALGRYGLALPIAFFTLAFGGGSLAGAFLLGPGVSRIAVVGALGVWAAGLVVAGIWQTDASVGTIEMTRGGELHNGGARLAFFGVTAAALMLPLHLVLTGQTRWLAVITAAGILVVGAFVLFRYWPGLIGVGATQRLLIVCVVLFHVVAAATVLAGQVDEDPTATAAR